MLPGFAYLFLLFNCKRAAKASAAEYSEKLIQHVSASLGNQAVVLQAHLCLRHLQTNSRSAAKRTKLPSFCNYLRSKQGVDAISNHTRIRILALEEKDHLCHYTFSLLPISLAFITGDPRWKGWLEAEHHSPLKAETCSFDLATL